MKKKDLARNVCNGCAGTSLLTDSETSVSSEDTKDDNRLDGRIDFMQNRYRDLINILIDTLDKETLVVVLEKLGSKCGDDFAKKYKNDPEGFFNFIKSHWADTVDYDKEKGIIRVNERVRNTCNCPLVREMDAPAILCNCSLGTQKRIYESLFGRPVNVTLNKSVLRGDERCSFTIQLL